MRFLILNNFWLKFFRDLGTSASSYKCIIIHAHLPKVIIIKFCAKVSTIHSKEGSISSKAMRFASMILFNDYLHVGWKLWWTKTRSLNHCYSKQFLYFMWMCSKTNQLRSHLKALQVWLKIMITKFCNWGHCLPNASPQFATINELWINSLHRSSTNSKCSKPINERGVRKI